MMKNDIFLSRILGLLDEKHLTKTEFLKKFSFSTRAFTSWKNGAVPNSERLMEVADFFEVSVDYILGRSNIRQISKTIPDLPIRNYELLALIENSNFSNAQAQILLDYVNIATHFREGE